MLPGFGAERVFKPAAFCTKKKVDNSRCEPDSSGSWVCKKGFSGETCYEEWNVNSQGCPTSFAACASSKVWADCPSC